MSIRVVNSISEIGIKDYFTVAYKTSEKDWNLTTYTLAPGIGHFCEEYSDDCRPLFKFGPAVILEEWDNYKPKHRKEGRDECF